MFKKIFLTVLAWVFLGCAGLMVMEPGKNLTAEYYETVYWGEQQVCIDGSATMTLSQYKTQRYYPKQDFNWVAEENANDGGIGVSLVWTSRRVDEKGSPAIGVCFDDSSVEGRFDYCGVMYFNSVEDRDIFINDFKGMGENVTPLIVNGMNLNPPRMLENLNRQIEVTKDLEIGKDFDVCGELWRWGL